MEFELEESEMSGKFLVTIERPIERKNLECRESRTWKLRKERRSTSVLEDAAAEE